MVSGVPECVLVSLTRMWVDDLVADIDYSSACFDGVVAESVVVVVVVVVCFLIF